MLPADTFYRIAQKASLANGDLLPLVIHATMAEVGFLFELDLDNYDAGIAPVLNRQKTNWQGAEAVAALVGFEMEKLAVQASTEGKPIWRFIKTNGKNYIGITVPVRLDRGRTKCISVVVQNTRSANGKSIAAVLQGYGNWFFFVDAGQEKGKKSWVFDNVAAIIELNGLCAAAGDFKEATGLMADHLQQLMNCFMVAIVTKKRGRFELASVSVGLELEQRSECSSILEASIAEAAKRKILLPKSMNSQAMPLEF